MLDNDLSKLNSKTWKDYLFKFQTNYKQYNENPLVVNLFRLMLTDLVQLEPGKKYENPYLQNLVIREPIVPMRPAPSPQIRSSLGRALVDPNPPSALTETTPPIRSSLARMLNPDPPSV